MKNWDWKLIAFCIIFFWLGSCNQRAMNGKDMVFYVGPDSSEAARAAISIVLWE